MKRERQVTPKSQQNNKYPYRSDSLRTLYKNLERPEALNVKISDISDLKKGQDKLMEGQEEIIKGQEKIVSELSKLTTSVDNLTKTIGALVEKYNGNGNNSKKDSLNQGLTSDYSKKSSGTAYYRRRDLDKKKLKKRKF